MEDGKLKNAGYSEDSGAGLRAIKGETQAYGYAQSFHPLALVTVARRVAAVADAGGPSVHLGDLAPVGFEPVLYQVAEGEELAAQIQGIALLRRADEAARAYSPKVKRVDLGLTQEVRILGLLNSDGACFVDLQPMLSLRVSVVAEDGTRRQQGSAGGGARMALDYFQKVQPEELAREAARIAVEMLDAQPAPAGEQTVVLAPGDSGVLLHEAVGHGLEGDFNRKGTSRYSGEVGSSVASSLCTVVDDGLILQSRGSIHVDDEGALPGKHVLIDKGILRSYMHDRLSAAYYSVSPTGNGRRESYRHPPVPRMTNTYMLPGESSPEEILTSTPRGIYCKTFSGGQVNISNGDFVFQVVESYLIEDGKLTAPLKDVVIIGNGPAALGRVVAVGNDLVFSDGRWTCGKAGQRVPVGIGIPTVKIDAITVGGTK